MPDVTVLIGNDPCSVTSQKVNSLTCTPTYKEDYVGNGERYVVQVRACFLRTFCYVDSYIRKTLRNGERYVVQVRAWS